MASPAWLARTVHEPAATTVMVAPLTVQVSMVKVASDTGNPELADTSVGTSNDVAPKVCAPGSAKVMVCDAFAETEKVCSTGVAVPYTASPACVASMVHEPIATVVIFIPLTVQIPGVRVVSVTGNPDVALAPDAKVTPGSTAPTAENAMVWLWVDTEKASE